MFRPKQTLKRDECRTSLLASRAALPVIVLLNVVNRHSYTVFWSLPRHWYHKPKGIFAMELTRKVLRPLTLHYVLSVFCSFAWKVKGHIIVYILVSYIDHRSTFGVQAFVCMLSYRRDRLSFEMRVACVQTYNTADLLRFTSDIYRFTSFVHSASCNQVSDRVWWFQGSC